MSTLILMLLTFTAGCAAAPTDPTPVKIDLPVYDDPEKDQVFDDPDKRQPEVAVPLVQASVVDDRSDFALSLISSKLHEARGILAGKRAPIGPARAGYAHPPPQNRDNVAFHQGIPDEYSAYAIFSPPVTSLEGVIMESEDVGSRVASVKDNIRHYVSGIFHPKPLLDTIREHEKYGNQMDHAAGRAIVAGVEGVSNLINTVLEVPGTIIKKITRTATEKLNNLGGRLIGL